MNKVSLLASIILILYSIQTSFAAVTNFEKGVAKISMSLGNADLVNVSIETIETPADYIYSKAYMWGGDESFPPKNFIKKITIIIGGSLSFIPLSAYADLGSPRKIALEKLALHGFRLIISGGDAAASYNANLDFKNNEIYRRKVVSAEFPKEVWEETFFSFNHLHN
ncbi:hypothetical protein KFZ76_02565 [Methylovulum psychrotolerans]|uniref:hypothetical protein n=1 Tax=Methylovulum psychrotolerans TaxID=1704499 RepID=UPI001BFEF561|nr:hypothetical protein [Methylovulum psychrotolerans]MBT9096594.1 hypothetical protein [Methylovulum psychrotolerans]